MSKNRIGGVMVSVLASSVVIVGSSPDRMKSKIMKLVFAASPPNTQNEGERAKTDSLGIRIMCQSGGHEYSRTVGPVS